MRHTPLSVVAVLLILCALQAWAGTPDPDDQQEGSGGTVLHSRVYRPADSMRFEDLYFRPYEDKRENLFGIPLKQELREGLTVGVTKHGINWRVDW